MLRARAVVAATAAVAGRFAAAASASGSVASCAAAAAAAAATAGRGLGSTPVVAASLAPVPDDEDVVPRFPAHRVFSPAAYRAHRRAAALHPDAASFDYLRNSAASAMIERLDDITRDFPVALDLGAHTGNIAAALAAARAAGSNAGGIKTLHMLNDCEEELMRDAATIKSSADLELRPVVSSLEGRLPFDDASLDIVLSSMAMHWMNDIPALLREVRRVLRPDGVLLAVMLGGDTLQELRHAFSAAEQERAGGVSPHTSPFLSVADVGNMVVGAGYGLPTIDTEALTVEYPDAAAAMAHLQGMGASAAIAELRPGAHRDTLMAATAAYQGMYGGADGSVPATFQLVHLIAWAPAPTQPQPLRRGSVPKGFGARGRGPPGEAPPAASDAVPTPVPPQ